MTSPFLHSSGLQPIFGNHLASWVVIQRIVFLVLPSCLAKSFPTACQRLVSLMHSCGNMG
jgi:hypothetical protein